jgi:hypothetical protein
VRNVRTKAQINKGATSIDSGRSIIWDLVLDDMLLVRIVLEHFKKVFLGNNKTFKGLLFLDSLVSECLNRRVIQLGNSTRWRKYR